MILNNSDLQHLRQVLDEQSGLDAELLARCGGLLHMGKYDQAVHSAFVLLEERMRLIVGRKGMTGGRMVHELFAEDGRLTRHLGLDENQRKKHLNLFEAAFSLYRNPAAHTITNYDAIMGKAIIGLVNLLLLILGEPSQWPEPVHFPENVEKAIVHTKETVSSEVAHRLNLFLSHCYKMGINTRDNNSTHWIPFICDAVQQLESWDEPRLHPLNLFYILLSDNKPGLYVPVNDYYTRVVGLDIEPLGEALRKIGFRPQGKKGEYRSYFAEHNSQAFFKAFLVWLKDVVEQLAVLEKTA